MSADTARTDPLVAALEWVAYNFGLEYRGIAWDNFAAQLRDRLAALPSAPDQRLLTAVEAAILNIQHNRIGAAIAGLRVARDLTRAALSEATPSPDA